MPVTRRSLLCWMSSSTFLLTAATQPLLAAEAGLTSVPDAEPIQQPPRSAADFPQGVASADPQTDAIMLWTRAVPRDTAAAPEQPVNLLLELSTDEEFTELLLSSNVSCDASSDYTLRAYVDGLQADTRYYYRFRGADGSLSRMGRTRTAPTAGAERNAKVAFASCQSYEQAHYGAWARMIAEDKAAPEQEQIDFVLHLGDFIYERSWHKRVDGTEQARTVPPFPDGEDTEENRYAVSLADYRHLYKLYLSDPHLQEARARWPFVCTWDDHEYSNDNYQSYSTYHGEHKLNPPRKQLANQAWFEFIPSILSELPDQAARDFTEHPLTGDPAADNQAAVDSLCIYRKLSWGKHLDIVITDSRSYRTPPCLPEDAAEQLGLPLNTVKLVEIADSGNTYNGGKPPEFLPYGDGTTENPGRHREPGTMLGSRQREWFLNSLAESRAPWKLWANAIPVTPGRLDLSSLPFTDYEDSVVNIDGWEGFTHELKTLMNALRERKVGGVVSLSGDHHMHAAGGIKPAASDPESPEVIVDFAVAGISSSPVFEDLVAAARSSHGGFSSLVYVEEEDTLTPVWNMSMLDGVMPAFLYANTSLKGPSRWLGPNVANGGLKFVDVSANGYGIASFGAQEAAVELVALEDCRAAFTKPPQVRYRASFRLPHWEGGSAPELAPPTFEGTPPFPFDQNPV